MQKNIVYKIMKTGIHIVTAVLCATVILSIFTLFYSYDGIHVTNKTGATDYVWRSGEHIATMTEGFAWLKMNEEGLNNLNDFRGCDILFMGSSHTDDLHFSSEKNASVLTEKITGLETYNIGMSGHTIYRCVDNFGDAINTYSPNKYVVIETSTIELDTDDMLDVINGTAEANPSYENGVIYYLQMIPVFKPIYKQLDQWISNTNVSGNISNSADFDDEKSEVQYDTVLRDFLGIISVKANEFGITPIIYYHPSEKLMSDGTVLYKTNESYLEAFANICKEQGIIFIDMTEIFHDGYDKYHKMAHGFINTAVGKGHLNSFGHELIAQKLSETIEAVEGKN